MPRRASRPFPAKPRRRPARRGRPAARRTKGDRRVWLVLGVFALLVILPPTRALVVRIGQAVEASLAASRAEAARERVIAEYAVRYGIRREMAAAIVRAAEAERVETELAFRLVRVESEFRERAVSPVGAIGLTQLMPATASELQPGITRAQMFDRDTNLRLGLRYFRRLLRRYDGDVEEALHAYNRGMGTVERIRAAGGDPANGYAEQVLGRKGASPVGRPSPADSALLRETSSPPHELPPARLPAGM